MGNTQGTATKVARAAGGDAKLPRTERGRRTLRKLLDAAAEEFGEKGFHEASVSSITRRAGTSERQPYMLEGAIGAPQQFYETFIRRRVVAARGQSISSPRSKRRSGRS